jgi:hypothetical protein
MVSRERYRVGKSDQVGKYAVEGSYSVLVTLDILRE